MTSGSDGEMEKAGESRSAKDTVLVLDAKSSLGEEVVLQLILKRVKVKALVNDEERASEAFGDYVTPVNSSIDDRTSIRRLLRGVKSVILVGNLGINRGALLMEACLSEGVEQVVLMSSCISRENFFAKLLVKQEQSILEDREREREVASSGVPYTIVRCGKLKDTMSVSMAAGSGRMAAIRVTKGEGSVSDSLQKTTDESTSTLISRSSFAYAAVSCLQFNPQNNIVELSELEDKVGAQERSAAYASTEGGKTFLVQSEEDWEAVFNSEVTNI